MFVDQCDHCHQDNPLDPDRDKIIIYIDHPECSWIHMTCNCGYRTRVYMDGPSQIVKIAHFLHTIMLVDFVPDEVQEGLVRANKRGLSLEEEAIVLSLEDDLNA